MHKHTCDGIIFDLDGTLLDTLQDIADAANEVLVERGWPVHPVDAYRFFVGSGVGHLMYCATPETHRDSNMDELISRFREKYGRNWRRNTKPYPGVPEMLGTITDRRITMSVLSNKPDSFTREFVSELLADWHFERVVGRLPDVPLKPDPTSTLEIARSMGTDPAQMVFVGDSAVDMKTATAAGMLPVGVTWGFRPRSELESGGALHTIDKPADLFTII